MLFREIIFHVKQLNIAKTERVVQMISDLVPIITSVGFPIVACVAMGYYVKYVTDENRKDIHDMNELHRSEMADITSALNNNTVALEKLCTMLEKSDS